MVGLGGWRRWMALWVCLGLGCGGGGGTPPAPTGVGGGAGGSSVVINELMAANVLSAKDDAGNPWPWLELYNPGDEDAALDGWAMTDDLSAPSKAPLPKGTVVPAHGYLVLWCDGGSGGGAGHVAIALTAIGGTVALTRPDGTFAQRLTYGAQAIDLSAAREPDGSSTWAIEWGITPGAANPPGTDNAPAGQPLSADAAEPIPAAGDVSDRVLGDDLVSSIELEIAPDGIDSLRAQPDGWVQATLVFQGRSYGPVGVNLKGTASFQPIDGAKPEFRVNMNKFAKNARFFGLDELLINNMTTDPAMMHERLAYWVGRQVGGVPASRSNHAMVTLNGQLLGLYAIVEEPRRELIARFFPDPSGSIYTIHYADFASQYLPSFELQDGPDNPGLVQAAANALAMDPPDQAIAAAASVVDMHQFNRYWALMVVTGHWGGWPYAPAGEPAGANAGVYENPATHQLEFIPEGINDAFMTADFDFIKEAKSVLTQKCAATPSCFQDFAAQVEEILSQVEQLDWAAEHDRIATQIAPYVSMDTRKPYSDADVAMYQQQMRYFETGRRILVEKYLVAPSP